MAKLDWVVACVLLIAATQAACGQDCCLDPPINQVEHNSCCECLPAFVPDQHTVEAEAVSFFPAVGGLNRVFEC
jgi:hypothetical protein